MNRRQLELAAKLYALATMAHLDLGDCEASEDAAKATARLSAKRAITKLRNLGVDKSEIIQIDDAIEIARQKRP